MNKRLQLNSNFSKLVSDGLALRAKYGVDFLRDWLDWHLALTFGLLAAILLRGEHDSEETADDLLLEMISRARVEFYKFPLQDLADKPR